MQKDFYVVLMVPVLKIFVVYYVALFFTASGENERVTVSDIETWMSKTPHLMNLFDTVFSSLFQFHSVRHLSSSSWIFQLQLCLSEKDSRCFVIISDEWDYGKHPCHGSYPVVWGAPWWGSFECPRLQLCLVSEL